MSALTDLPERSRGRYEYRLDGAAVPVDERFVLGEVTPGVVRVRSTRVGAHPTFRLEADVRYEPGGMCARLRWTGSDPAVPASAVADYRVRGQAIHVARTVDGTASTDSAAGLLLPLLRVFAGRVVTAAAAAPVDVVVPDLRDPGDSSRLLAPLNDRRTATSLDPVEHSVDGMPVQARAYALTGGSYGEVGARFTVDSGGLLLGYDWDQPGGGHWEVRLAGVSGPWPTLPPTSPRT